MYSAYCIFLKSHNSIPTYAEFQTLNGPTLDLIVHHLVRTHKISTSFNELLVQYQKLIDSEYQNVIPNEGILPFIERAKDEGFILAIVTSSKRNSVRHWLKLRKLEHYFSAVIGAEDVDEGKPAPMPYLQALKLIECDPETSFAIEDSYAGIQSATSAGLKTFQVGNLPKYNGQSSEKVTLVPSFRNITEILNELPIPKN